MRREESNEVIFFFGSFFVNCAQGRSSRTEPEEIDERNGCAPSAYVSSLVVKRGKAKGRGFFERIFVGVWACGDER